MTNMTLVEALLRRRSRRFGLNMNLPAGPLAFGSTQAPEPLTFEQEATLAFAAVGITGTALGEMDYTSGTVIAGGGNILAGFVGRTAASAESIQSIGLVVINDDGAWYVRRPQELPGGELPALIELGKQGQFAEWYERIRVRIASKRVEIPRQAPFTPPFNRWDTNAPGTTCFLPIVEATTIFLNCLLTAMSEELGIYILDDGLDEQGGGPFLPAGLEAFAKHKGGQLRSDGKDIGFVITITFFETTLLQFLSAELGGVLQNLSLMTQALGLGGFIYAAQHPIWLKQLGFLDQPVAFERIMGVGPVTDQLLTDMGYGDGVPTFTMRNPTVTVPAADLLPRSFCPPDYPTMSAAIDAFIEQKYAADKGLFRGGASTAWKNSKNVEQGIQSYSQNAISAAKAYCEYVFRRYKRFPTLTGPISTLLAYQAHELDRQFYERFYKDGVLP